MSGARGLAVMYATIRASPHRSSGNGNIIPPRSSVAPGTTIAAYLAHVPVRRAALHNAGDARIRCAIHSHLSRRVNASGRLERDNALLSSATSASSAVQSLCLPEHYMNETTQTGAAGT